MKTPSRFRVSASKNVLPAFRIFQMQGKQSMFKCMNTETSGPVRSSERLRCVEIRKTELE